MRARKIDQEKRDSPSEVDAFNCKSEATQPKEQKNRFQFAVRFMDWRFIVRTELIPIQQPGRVLETGQL